MSLLKISSACPRKFLNIIKISENEIKVVSTYREYCLDISKIKKSEIEGMVRLLKKQNHDNQFTIQIA